MTEFHKSTIGKIYHGKHVPELIKELRRIADSLEKGNKIFEKELKIEKKNTKKNTEIIQELKQESNIKQKESIIDEEINIIDA